MTTTRVERLLAEGIAIAARRLYRIEVTSREAQLLARGGSIWLALEKLGNRLDVKRSVPGDQAGDAAFQERLAVVEVAAEMSGVFDAERKRELITGLLEAETNFRIEREGGPTVQAIGETAGFLREQGNDLSRFTRLAHRMLSEQRSMLELHIVDDELRGEASAQLEAIYRRYLDTAFRLSMPDGRAPETAQLITDAR